VREIAGKYGIKPDSFKSGVQMAKPNYSYEKRQREIAKKKKKEEKRKKKQGTKDDSPASDSRGSEVS
jgi:hypothetical protein